MHNLDSAARWEWAPTPAGRMHVAGHPMMGKLSHAVDAVPSLWDDFISLVISFGNQSFTKFKKITCSF